MNLNAQNLRLDKNEIEINRDTYYLFFWFFITILPQILLLSKGDHESVVLKAGLYSTFLLLTFLKTFKNRTKVILKYVLSSISLAIILIFSNFVISQSNASASIMVNISVILLNYIILMVIFGNIRISILDLARMALLYEIFILYACVINFVEYGNMFSLILRASYGHQFSFRSFFTNRNTFALFLFVGVIFTTLRLTITKSRFDKVVLLTIICNLFLTLSRTSILGICVFFVIFYIMKYKRDFVKSLIKIVLVLSVVAALIVFVLGWDFISGVLIRANRGTSGRTLIWSELWKAYISGSLLFGQGFGILNDYFTHNSYIEIIVVGGLTSVLFYLWFYLETFAVIRKVLAFDNEIGSVFVAAFLGFLTVTMFESGIPFASSAKDTIFTLLFFLLPRYYLNYLRCSCIPKSSKQSEIH